MTSFSTVTVIVAVVYMVAGINTVYSIIGGEKKLHSDENLPSAAVNFVWI